MNRLALFACLAAAVLVTGCASTVQHVPMPDQSKVLDDPGKGRIYVMRPSGFGSAISMHVMDGGDPIGETGPGGYLCWERAPGDVIVSGSAENASRVSLPVRAGNVYYIWQHVRMGWWIARTDLEVLDETHGKEVLKKCKPAKIEKLEGVPIAIEKK